MWLLQRESPRGAVLLQRLLQLHISQNHLQVQDSARRFGRPGSLQQRLLRGRRQRCRQLPLLFCIGRPGHVGTEGPERTTRRCEWFIPNLLMHILILILLLLLLLLLLMLMLMLLLMPMVLAMAMSISISYEHYLHYIILLIRPKRPLNYVIYCKVD